MADWLSLTTGEFTAEPRIAVLPVAAVEQHGPHLPVGVDTYIAEAYLMRVRALLPHDTPAVILPVQAVGASDEHKAFPGTLTLSPETALHAFIEIGESVARAGIRKLVIINSHGGNLSIIDLVARQLRVRHRLARKASLRLPRGSPRYGAFPSKSASRALSIRWLDRNLCPAADRGAVPWKYRNCRAVPGRHRPG